ncbi:unnamed protein product [Rhizopus stolonifer]
MPPHSFPITFEEIEAKEWASNTVKKILTEVSPVSFESKDLQVIEKEPEGKSKKRRSLKRVSTLRRSFSFLEGSLFRSHHEQRKKSRSLSTDYQLLYPAPKESISSRIRPSWPMDRTKTIPTPDVISTHYLNKVSSKERKGIAIWKSTYAAYMAKPPLSLNYKPKPISKRSIQLSKYIRTELLTTEDTYLDHLMTIKKYYMDPLFQAASQKRSLVNQKDMDIIFAHIPQLINVSSSLVECLHRVSDNKQDSAPMGKIFCDYTSYFDVYIAYAVNFSKSRKYLNKASSNIVYHQLVKVS